MASPTTARFGKMIVSLAVDPDYPDVFAVPCGLTTKAFTLNKGLSEVSIPDCDDPDAPLWLGRDVQNLSATISGDGVLAAESQDTWLDAAYSTESIMARVEIEFTTGVLSFTGLFMVESFGITANQGERVTSAISMQSDGAIAREWEPVSA